MNLKQALYIKTIAECGSITAAAKKLYVSQPSLSQMLRHVEEELGLTLFDRSVSPFRLTYAGERYLHTAGIILSASEELEEQLREIRQEESGRLRLGISFSRGLQVLPMVIPVFQKRYPNVILELTECGSAALEDLLLQGRIDLALAALESTSNSLCYELIERETIGILAGRSSKLAQRLPSGTGVTIEDAAEDQFVSLRRGHSARVVQDQLFRKAGIDPVILLETDALEIGKRVALTSGACMVLPSIYIDGIAAALHGEYFPLLDADQNRHFYACYRKESFIPKYTRDFIRFVIEVLEKRPPIQLTDD